MKKEHYTSVKSQIIIGSIKVVIAAIIAFLLLSIFAYFYYNIPSRVESTTYSTDFSRTSNDSYFKMTEGFGVGKTDARGFNNLNVVENPDVLIIGSSQSEGYNVSTEQNISAVLNKLFAANNYNLSAYNIGVSGHNFGVCLNNLGEAYQEFRPKKYVVIETTGVFLAEDSLKKLHDGTYPRDIESQSKLVTLLKKSDYLRLLYTQISSLRAQQSTAPAPEFNYTDENIALLDTALKTATAEVGDCRLIIVLSSGIKLDGTNVKERGNAEEFETFKRLCVENNIVFLDTYDDFKAFYEENKILPTGFTNTRIGEGHLNRYGHKIIAEKLYSTITEMEEKK